NCRGWIHSSPSVFRKPNLAPRVRVRLPDQEEMPEIVLLTPEISDNNARRDSCQPHQSSETRGVMLAKADATTKKKFVEIMVFARRQGIAEALCAKELKRTSYYGARVQIAHCP